MEILQTIWNALTIENEGLLKIISIPFMFIEAYVIMLLFITILNINTTKKQQIFYVLFWSVSSLIIQFFVAAPYNSFINVLIALLLMRYVFKLNFLKSIIAFTVPYFITVILGSFVMNLYTILFNIGFAEANSTPIYKIFFASISYTSMYFLSKFIKKFEFNISSISELKKNNKHILLINFILGMISIIIQSYLATFYSNYLSLPLTLCNLLILLLYFVISFYSLSRTTKLEKTTRDLEGEKLVNKSLTILHDNIRAFKHDFNNIVQAIGGYVSTDDLEGLKKYYSQLLKDCQGVNNLTALSPDVINNPAIYSILASKYHKANELGIQINLEVFLDLTQLTTHIYEITRILGILLDNAIEATLECEEKLIKIELRNDSSHHKNLVIIKNTYLNKDINIDKIFEKSYSTKPNNSGIGLWEVRQILKKNLNTLDLFTTKDDAFFTQQLEIYY